MAVVKVKKKKVPSAKLPSQMNQAPLVGATPSFMGGNLVGATPSFTGGDLVGAAPSFTGGDLVGANTMKYQPVPKAEGMKQQIDRMEILREIPERIDPNKWDSLVSKSASMPKAKVKTKKAVQPSEPLSPQTWANIGNNPADYPAYLAAWKKQSGKK